MNFTEFKFDPAEVAQRAATMRANFARGGRPGTFEENALRVIGERMEARPAQHVEFGPYWWAVKQALNNAGAGLGDYGDALVAAEYRHATALETIVAAEMFKDYYRGHYFVGARVFNLTADGEPYELFDPDMQARVGDGAQPRKAADMAELAKVIAGTHPFMLEPDMVALIEGIAGRYPDDSAMQAEIERAVNAYVAAALAATAPGKI